MELAQKIEFILFAAMGLLVVIGIGWKKFHHRKIAKKHDTDTLNCII